MKIVLTALVVATLTWGPAHARESTRHRQPLLGTLGQEPRFEQVFGQRMAYYEYGARHRGRGPTLILIPHLAWDSNAWASNVGELGARYHVIAVDPLGHGRSDKPMLDYKMDTWTDTIAEFVRRRHLGRAVFGGAGMGGALSVQMALDHPRLVSGIIVAASNSGPGEHAGAARPSGPYGPSLAGTRNYLLDNFYDDSLVTEEVVRARFEYRLRANDGYVIQRHLADHRAPYSVDELARITVPALFPWCRDDTVTPLGWGEDFARALPHGRLVVLERCGHFPNMEQPEQFNAAVLAFLASLPTR
ncbi:MAG TPA: alpha/beta hydrolase [Allosphingosinicella sp.]|jgi:pimeloyl-ACP methyl ester carboxylesterase